ncbi:hypothetical protein D3C76_125140 [compost metagenome]
MREQLDQFVFQEIMACGSHSGAPRPALDVTIQEVSSRAKSCRQGQVAPGLAAITRHKPGRHADGQPLGLGNTEGLPHAIRRRG